MDRIISVLRVRSNRHFLLRPMGTFEGYGAYVGINPSRELAADSSAETLGAAIIELLQLSKPTGYRVEDIEQYRRDTGDADSDAIRTRYFSRVRSTAETNRKFLHTEVATKDKQVSWRVTKFVFNVDHDTLVPENKLSVKMSEGAEALGRCVLDFLCL